MYSVDWKITETVYEENMIEQPFYTFIPRDQYGNQITDPAQLPADINTLKAYIIDGVDYTDYTQSPVDYETTVFGSKVNIQVRSNDATNLSDENEQTYAQLPQREQAWTLEVRYAGQKKEYGVVLKGNGSGDVDTTTLPLDMT